MRRGEIVIVSLDPSRGAEATKTRPAVVVSNDAANTTATRLGRGVITVVPVTSSITRIYPFQVLLPAEQTGLPRDSKAQAEQIRSVARLKDYRFEWVLPGHGERAHFAADEMRLQMQRLDSVLAGQAR